MSSGTIPVPYRKKREMKVLSMYPYVGCWWLSNKRWLLLFQDPKATPGQRYWGSQGTIVVSSTPWEPPKFMRTELGQVEAEAIVSKLPVDCRLLHKIYNSLDLLSTHPIQNINKNKINESCSYSTLIERTTVISMSKVYWSSGHSMAWTALGAAMAIMARAPNPKIFMVALFCLMVTGVTNGFALQKWDICKLWKEATE